MQLDKSNLNTIGSVFGVLLVFLNHDYFFERKSRKVVEGDGDVANCVVCIPLFV